MEFLLPLVQIQHTLFGIADVNHHAIPQKTTVRLGDGHRVDPNPAHLPGHLQSPLPVQRLAGRHPGSAELLKALSACGVDGLEGEVGIGLQGLQLRIQHRQPATAGEQTKELAIRSGSNT